MTVHVVADDPRLLRSHLPVRDRAVETGQTPDAVSPNRDEVVVCRSLSEREVESTVSTLAADAVVVFVYTETANATLALDAGAVTTVPDPQASGSSDHLAAAVERLRDRTSEIVSPISAALDDHPDIFFAFDLGGELLEWNDTLRETTGYDDELIAEMDPVDFFGPDAAPRVENAIGRAVVDGKTRVTAPLRTADGGEIPFEFTALLVDRSDRQAIVGSGRRIDDEADVLQLPESSADAEKLDTQVTINRLFGAVVDAVVEAETREGTERAICEALTSSDLFRFAWVGEYEADADRVEPRAWAGAGADYLDDRPGPMARTESQTTALEVVTTGESRIISDVGADQSASIWRAAALAHGHRSAVAVPISRADATYGCLSVYAGERAAFDEIDSSVFDRLGSLLGYAIRTTEVRRSLVADTAIELQFQITDPEAFVVSAARRTDGRLDLIDTVERPDGAIVQLFTVRGIPRELLETLAAESPVPVQVVADRESEVLLRATIEGESLAHALADAGGEITSITATNEQCRVSARLPSEADIGTALDNLRSVYDIELLSKRAVSQDSLPSATFRADVAQHLTDRQLEVVRVAYNAGFFDWPREQSGDEMAELLDISPPTFHQHRRTAQRKLFEVLFEDID